MHQKLFTIYLTEDVDEDRTLQDHLAEYLDTGWRIASITPLGQGGGGEDVLSCWFAVLLERAQ